MKWVFTATIFGTLTLANASIPMVRGEDLVLDGAHFQRQVQEDSGAVFGLMSAATLKVTVFKFRVYTCALYLESSPLQGKLIEGTGTGDRSERLWKMPLRKRIVLSFHRSLSGQKLADSFKHTYLENTPAPSSEETKALTDVAQRLGVLDFQDNDRLVIDISADHTTLTAERKAQPPVKIEMAGAALARGTLWVWFGPKAADHDIREALLNGVFKSS